MNPTEIQQLIEIVRLRVKQLRQTRQYLIKLKRGTGPLMKNKIRLDQAVTLLDHLQVYLLSL